MKAVAIESSRVTSAARVAEPDVGRCACAGTAAASARVVRDSGRRKKLGIRGSDDGERPGRISPSPSPGDRAQLSRRGHYLFEHPRSPPRSGLRGHASRSMLTRNLAALTILMTLASAPSPTAAQEPDWSSARQETVGHLQAMIR